MKFENTFTVVAPIDEVWAALMDIERVAPCMPGAEVLERTGENAYRVGVKVKLGPMSMLYRGQVEIAERDDAARHAVMRARATEARGQGTANAGRTHESRRTAGQHHGDGRDRPGDERQGRRDGSRSDR
jgi:carbon monoxide dehydrogenase subunit G